MAIVFVLWLFAAARPAAAQQAAQSTVSAGTPELAGALTGDAWREALVPLETMPVQDYGYIRSGYTFGENHLRAIGGKSTLDGMGPLASVIWLMANPEKAAATPIIKIVRPEVGELFGAKRISLNQYLDPTNHARLVQMVQKDQEAFLRPANELEEQADHLENLERDWAIVPRAGSWLSPVEMAAEKQIGTADRRILTQWAALKAAIRANDPAAGGEAARELATAVRNAAVALRTPLPHLKLDVFYHRGKPFEVSAGLYLLAALFYGAAILFKRSRLGWAGYALMAAGFAEEAVGITARWILAGRAPLSNMYESFTFAVGGLILIALIFEAIWRTRLAGLGGSILGFVFMVLAHKLPIFKSEIQPLMPALQSSWLTYHVVVIMLSYSAFALSFFASIIYLAKDAMGGDQTALAPLRRLPTLQALDVFNYKIIAVGFPLLTLGIIFGAVWAATAWGRPWGFDPKETWSAITWLIYAIYLHARYLAGWQGRRAAYLALLGFAAVLFTYVGVNYLLPGLHSYASS
ncbi:MAG: c-type cytochrome biogenesis protein CcsB [bacterium]|nr:c-type cytochrome biogenesis protein CcsB [bacterium]